MLDGAVDVFHIAGVTGGAGCSARRAGADCRRWQGRSRPSRNAHGSTLAADAQGGAKPAPAPKLAAKAKAEADDEWAEF